MDLKTLLESLGEKVGTNANVKRVFGDPVAAEGRTIIPVARIGYGFGVGGGGAHGGAERSGEGGGGGGGAGAVPVGVLEITAQETRFIPFHQNRKLLAAFAAGAAFGMMVGRRRRK